MLPMIMGADWWPDKFNLTHHLTFQSFRLEFFASHKTSRCDDPRYPEKKIVCWKFNHAFSFLHKLMVTYRDQTRADFWGMLTEVNFTLTVDDAIMQSSIDHLFLFFEQIVNIDYPGRKPDPIIIRIKDIGRTLMPNSKLNLDWLTFVNNGFFKRSQATSGDEEILIEDPEILAKSMILIEETAPRIMSDVFMLAFLIGYQHMYVVYPFRNLDSYKVKIVILVPVKH